MHANCASFPRIAPHKGGGGGRLGIGKRGMSLLGEGGMLMLGAGAVELFAGAEFSGEEVEHASVTLESLTFSLARTCIRERYRVICEAYSRPAALFMRSRVSSACPQFWAHKA